MLNSLLITRTFCEIKFVYSLFLIVHIVTKKSLWTPSVSPLQWKLLWYNKIIRYPHSSSSFHISIPYSVFTDQMYKDFKVKPRESLLKTADHNKARSISLVSTFFNKISGILMELQRMNKLWYRSLAAS